MLLLHVMSTFESWGCAYHSAQQAWSREPTHHRRHHHHHPRAACKR